MTFRTYRPVRGALLSTSMLLLGVAALPSVVSAASLTILHNNDGESQLINAGSGLEEFGGAARFVTIVNQVRAERESADRDVITLSSGDNFLAGPEFNASLSDGIFYDAQVLNAINYDAIVLGNHDFDFGPDILADFIDSVDAEIPYLSANLDFAGEANLQNLVDQGRIRKSTIIERDGEQYGIVGATTEALASISSPGDVEIGEVVSSVQGEIDALTDAGVNKIIFVSHLQGIDTDIAVLEQLNGVDVAIAGGGDEFLANEGDVLNPEPDGPYPLLVNGVPVVTTQGEYRYLGVLDIEFDGDGNLLSISDQSGPVLVTGVEGDADILNNVVSPVQAAIDALATNVIATSEVGLDGVRGNIRTQETNLGNLITDAFVWQAEQVAAGDESVSLLTGDAVIGLANGGGIRNNNVIPVGEISELDTFDILPFTNFLSVINDVTPQDLLTILDHAVGAVEFTSGRFAQISGINFAYDPEAEAGSRVVEITLADGTPIYLDGEFLFDGVFDLVTVDFLARGGDSYPFADLGIEFSNLGISYQQALFNFITEGLNGVISAADYSEGGEGRITALEVTDVPAPGALGLLGLAVVGIAMRRRQRA